MSYDDRFYKQYSKYLVEPRVRAVHDNMIELHKMMQPNSFKRVMDLGCGHGHEFLTYGKPEFYYGIDHNPQFAEMGTVFVMGDYRNCFPFLKSQIENFRIDTVVSLFSTECTAPAKENALLYRRLFEETKINTILTSGFYYSNNPKAEIVDEDGIPSYQTKDKPVKLKRVPWRGESRFRVPCPSTMFGDEVVEVWRLLYR